MADALRRLAEGAPAVGLPATYEATHHGPELALPAFFIEVGGNDPDHPPPAAIDLIARVLTELEEDPSDLVVLGAGGGHYAPHFSDLARKRKFAFGHILSRHALGGLTVDSARAAWDASGAPAGVVYARAADAELPVTKVWGRRVRENEAPKRPSSSIPSPSGGDRSAGT